MLVTYQSLQAVVVLTHTLVVLLTRSACGLFINESLAIVNPHCQVCLRCSPEFEFSFGAHTHIELFPKSLTLLQCRESQSLRLSESHLTHGLRGRDQTHGLTCKKETVFVAETSQIFSYILHIFINFTYRSINMNILKCIDIVLMITMGMGTNQ